MVHSKSLLFVALLCAFLLVSSPTSAAETKPQQQTKEDNVVKEPDQRGSVGGRCVYGCCGWGLYGMCNFCCKTKAEAEAAQASVGTNGHGGGGGVGGGGGGGGGQHCRYGCCGGYGRYCRCCYNPEEAQAVHFGN